MPSTNGHGPKGGAGAVALCLRVSSEEQRDRETIEIQRDFLAQYCELYGLEVADVYADDDVSGTIPLHERPQTAGVSLRSATEPIDTSPPSGRLIFQMLGSFAEYERETIGERTRAGLRRAFRNGTHVGRIPYGYDINEDGAFEVVEHEARVVREIVANVAGGASLYSEAVHLNDQDEPSPGRKFRGKPRAYGAHWSQSTVREMVAKTTYAGIHVV